MTKKYTLIHGVWKKISAAGEGGTIWVSSLSEGFIFIDHTDAEGGDDIAEGSTINLLREKAFVIKRVPDHPLCISPDNSNDIYYVLYIDSRPGTLETAVIIADMV